MHLFFLCSRASAEQSALITQVLVNESFKGIDITGIDGAATEDPDHGREAVALFSHMHDIDVVIAYGTTSKTFGDQMEWLSARAVVLPRHGKASKLICLPSARSRWWGDPANAANAVLFVKLALDGETPSPAEFSCWPTMAWN